MRIVFVSNYFNHHQVAICDELYQLSDGHFLFVETEEMSDMRKKLGYSVLERPYIMRVWADPEMKTKALDHCAKADVLIAGGGSFVVEYEKERLMKGKLTLEYAERSLKKGWINLFSPTNIKMQLYYHLFFYDKPFFKLCASAFTAKDMYVQRAFVDRCFKYGYFPRTQEISDIEKFMDAKYAEKRLRIVWCARFLDWKHPELVVRMAEQLVKLGYDFEVNMIGSGELQGKIETMIRQKHLSDHVHLLGSIPNRNVMEEMARSHVFLFTSDRNEGWGVVLNEAMGQGCCPIVSNMVGAAPYLIDNKKNGLLFESGNLDALVENMKYLLDHPDDCQQMAKQAYQSISTLWSPQTAAKRLYEFCESYLKGDMINYAEGPMSVAQLL